MGIAQDAQREGHAAVNKIARYAMILGVLRGNPMTARQVAKVLGFNDLNAVKPRLSEMAKDGRVRRIGTLRDDVTKVHVSVYEVVDSA